MLNIYFGKWDYEDDNYLWTVVPYFNNNYENEWINNEVSKQIIKDIDNCDVIQDNLIISPIFGMISPKDLSSGSKLLITMNIEKNRFIYNGTKCGENCSDWLLKLSNNVDIIINRGYPIEFGYDNFNVKILNDNSIVTNNDDLLLKYINFCELNKNEGI